MDLLRAEVIGMIYDSICEFYTLKNKEDIDIYDYEELENFDNNFQNVLQSRVNIIKSYDIEVRCGSYKFAVVVPELELAFKFDKPSSYFSEDPDNIEAEYMKYLRFKEKDIDFILLPLTKVMTVSDGLCIYEQPLATNLDDNYDISYSNAEDDYDRICHLPDNERTLNESRAYKTINSHSLQVLSCDEVLFFAFLEEYGFEKMDKLIKISEEDSSFCICDLHDSNIGYCNGNLVIMDYNL